MVRSACWAGKWTILRKFPEVRLAENYSSAVIANGMIGKDYGALVAYFDQLIGAILKTAQDDIFVPLQSFSLTQINLIEFVVRILIPD